MKAADTCTPTQLTLSLQEHESMSRWSSGRAEATTFLMLEGVDSREVPNTETSNYMHTQEADYTAAAGSESNPFTHVNIHQTTHY